MIHNVCITYISLEIIKQLFYVKTTAKQTLLYLTWIQIVFIFNDYVIQTNFDLQYKYLTIFVGFVIAFVYIIKLSKVASVLVMVISLTINGMATNLNILALTLNQFSSYGEALEHDFIQYTSLVMVTGMIYMVMKTFNVRVLDVSKYN